MEGAPKFTESQTLPSVSYADFARGLGLHAMTIDKPEQLGDAWEQALSADRPTVLDIHCDPSIPPIPPHATLEQMVNSAKSILQGATPSAQTLRCSSTPTARTRPSRPSGCCTPPLRRTSPGYEEPVSSDHLGELRTVRELVDADVTAGEYGTDLFYFQRMCAAEAVDCLQVDATRCGGYTEWLRVAAVAASYGLQVSGHCAPHLHAQVAAATQNLRHLEWFHDHVRIEEMLFDGTFDPTGGFVTPDLGRPGNGFVLDEDAAGAYRVGT